MHRGFGCDQGSVAVSRRINRIIHALCSDTLNSVGTRHGRARRRLGNIAYTLRREKLFPPSALHLSDDLVVMLCHDGCHSSIRYIIDVAFRSSRRCASWDVEVKQRPVCDTLRQIQLYCLSMRDRRPWNGRQSKTKGFCGVEALPVKGVDGTYARVGISSELSRMADFHLKQGVLALKNMSIRKSHMTFNVYTPIIQQVVGVYFRVRNALSRKHHCFLAKADYNLK